MFKLVVAVLALAVVGIQGRPYSDAVVYDCTDKPDGIYGDATDPKAFFVCTNGVVTEKAFCVDGYKFNGVDACVPEVEEEEIKTDEVAENEKEEEERRTIPQVFTDNNDDGFFDDDFENMSQGNKIFNIEFTKNIFPKSVVIIGKMNREQKNK